MFNRKQLECLVDKVGELEVKVKQLNTILGVCSTTELDSLSTDAALSTTLWGEACFTYSSVLEALAKHLNIKFIPNTTQELPATWVKCKHV